MTPESCLHSIHVLSSCFLSPFLGSWSYCPSPLVSISNIDEIGLWLLSVLLCNSTLPPDSWLHPPCWSQAVNGCISVLLHFQPPCGCTSIASRSTQTDLGSWLPEFDPGHSAVPAVSIQMRWLSLLLFALQKFVLPPFQYCFPPSILPLQTR